MCTRKLTLVLLLVSVAVPLGTTGCAARASSNDYDPYHDYNDYDAWNSSQETFYIRWKAETRKQRLDFRKLCNGEKKEEWTCRR